MNIFGRLCHRMWQMVHGENHFLSVVLLVQKNEEKKKMNDTVCKAYKKRENQHWNTDFYSLMNDRGTLTISGPMPWFIIWPFWSINETIYDIKCATHKRCESIKSFETNQLHCHRLAPQAHLSQWLDFIWNSIKVYNFVRYIQNTVCLSILYRLCNVHEISCERERFLIRNV